jgi:hypothetical protein
VNALLSQQQFESLETLAKDDGTRDLCLHLAALSRAGRLEPMVEALQADGRVDEPTRELVTELAGDEALLHAVEEYVHSTSVEQ